MPPFPETSITHICMPYLLFLRMKNWVFFMVTGPGLSNESSDIVNLVWSQSAESPQKPIRPALFLTEYIVSIYIYNKTWSHNSKTAGISLVNVNRNQIGVCYHNCHGFISFLNPCDLRCRESPCLHSNTLAIVACHFIGSVFCYSQMWWSWSGQCSSASDQVSSCQDNEADGQSEDRPLSPCYKKCLKLPSWQGHCLFHFRNCTIFKK